jgi:hypothetical protein
MASIISPFLIGTDNIGPYPYYPDTTENMVNPVLLDQAQWNDINMAINTARHPGSTNPTSRAFTTNIELYTFAEGDYVDLTTTELFHDWAEGTELRPHLHIITADTQGEDRTIQFTMYYSMAKMNGVATAEASSTTGVYTILANTPDRTHLYLPMTAITMTNYTIGTQFAARLKRIAIAGSDPSAAPFVCSLGFHYQINSLGSTSEGTK